jgi:DNA-directed RNA polymerase subunit RPC12/RpoP
MLWLCYLLPGLIYSVWRQSTRYSACPECGVRNMIPVDSPAGRRIVGG